KRPAMLYFSAAPAVLDSVDPQQYSALKAFKDSCKSRGLFVTYSDVEDFRRKFSKDLQIVMNTADDATDRSEPAPSNSSKAPTLSDEAKRLLKAASNSEAGGVILFERFGGGAQIQ